MYNRLEVCMLQPSIVSIVSFDSCELNLISWTYFLHPSKTSRQQHCLVKEQHSSYEQTVVLKPLKLTKFKRRILANVVLSVEMCNLRLMWKFGLSYLCCLHFPAISENIFGNYETQIIDKTHVVFSFYLFPSKSSLKSRQLNKWTQLSINFTTYLPKTCFMKTIFFFFKSKTLLGKWIFL